MCTPVVSTVPLNVKIYSHLKIANYNRYIKSYKLLWISKLCIDYTRRKKRKVGDSYMVSKRPINI